MHILVSMVKQQATVPNSWDLYTYRTEQPNFA